MTKSITSTPVSSNNSNTKGNKHVQDHNSIVVNGAIINNASVTEKRQQAVVLNYTVDGKNCSGVMHVSQFPSLERHTRDQMFADAAVGAKYDGLLASVEAADKSQGRRFTTVRLSARKPLEQAAEAQRKAAQAARENRETALANALSAVDGKVVTATVKQLAFSKDAETRQETDHCFGAFLKTTVGEVEVSGLLHTSRMMGKGRIERLIAAFQDGSKFEVLATVTEKGVSFSEEGVMAAKEAAVVAQRLAQQADESANFLAFIREALAAGSAEKMSFQAKVTVNRLESNGGISAEACGVAVEVSSQDLGIPANNLRGTGHKVKLVAVSEQDGVVTAKRVVKGK